MSVYEMMMLLCEDDAIIAIYDFRSEEEVFCGEAADAIDCAFCDCEVMSFDLCRDDARGVQMILNIESEEE